VAHAGGLDLVVLVLGEAAILAQQAEPQLERVTAGRMRDLVEEALGGERAGVDARRAQRPARQPG
jgi:hypothetical protein